LCGSFELRRLETVSPLCRNILIQTSQPNRENYRLVVSIPCRLERS
jgi:hypothetical protein